MAKESKHILSDEEWQLWLKLRENPWLKEKAGYWQGRKDEHINVLRTRGEVIKMLLDTYRLGEWNALS